MREHKVWLKIKIDTQVVTLIDCLKAMLMKMCDSNTSEAALFNAKSVNQELCNNTVMIFLDKLAQWMELRNGENGNQGNFYGAGIEEDNMERNQLSQ